MSVYYFNFIESDYEIIENTATFQSGKTETSFCIKISHDTILEGNETFSVTAVPSSPTAKYFIRCNATTIVTILDDDSKSLYCVSRATVY